jgi:hypothetical protein
LEGTAGRFKASSQTALETKAETETCITKHDEIHFKLRLKNELQIALK